MDRLTNVNSQLEFEFFLTIPSLSYREQEHPPTMLWFIAICYKVQAGL